MKAEGCKDETESGCRFILPPSDFILQTKTPLVTKRQAAWRTVRARNSHAHPYGAPLDMLIPRMQFQSVNILDSTMPILPQLARVAKSGMRLRVDAPR
jgi:hypothetical protein